MQKRAAFQTAGGQVILLSAFTLLVKAIGFVKQAIIAAYFGAGGATDVFFVASDFFADLSAVFFSPLAIVFLTTYDLQVAQRGRGHADAFAVKSLVTFSLFSAVAAVLFAGFAEIAAKLLGFGFSSALQQELTKLLRLLSPVIVFYCAAALLTAQLQAQKHFLPAQGRGLVRSVAIIAAVWLLSSHLGAGALVVGMLAALLLETAYLCWAARKSLVPALSDSSDVDMPGSSKKLITAAFPLMLSYAAAEFSHIVDKAIASRLQEGAVSALSYAQVLQGFAAALLVSNVGAVTFSHFSEKSAHSDSIGLIQSLCRAAELLILLLLPISIVAAVASPRLVQLVYARGSFDARALTATAQAFSGYAVGLVGLSLQTVFLRGLYAVGNTRLPLKIGLWSIALNVSLSWTLSGIFGVGGIALASAMSYYLGAALSSAVIQGRQVLPNVKAVVAAGLVCAGCVVAVGRFPVRSAFLSCALLGLSGTGSYCMTLLLLREPNTISLVQLIFRQNSGKYK
ncbi:murein biosynthesis integral membrane protein MurJ [Oscillospiraceae bacterium LTW-04]|nr:lipid II flippase MurJ [Oscillospiraceae bacterium MB24-C1]